MGSTKSIKQMRRVLSELSKTMYMVYVEWRICQRHTFTEAERMAEDMYKMMIFKAKSIWLMSKGIIIIRTQKDIILDPSTMYPVLRSMYELFFLFRCMFVSSINDKERETLLSLWKIKGNRNLIKKSNENLDDMAKNQAENARDENEKLKERIRELMTELCLTQTITKDIEKKVKDSSLLQGYMFKHDEQDDKITGFCALPFSDADMGVRLSGNSRIYSHYSAHSHPSSLGVKHFEEMYPLNEEDKYMQEILQHTCKYLVRFMEAFCEYTDSYRPFYIKKESKINNLLNRIS